MDRLALNLAAKRIQEALDFNDVRYGLLETTFGLGFAAGAPLLGWLVDRGNLRWLYPVVVLAWSGAGFLTGFVTRYEELAVCRFLLGFAEGGHFPCALKITQALLDSQRRPLGNSMVQSGGAIGAILTPQLIAWLLPITDTWRTPFVVIGSFGAIWVVVWLLLTARMSLTPPVRGAQGGGTMWDVWTDRRYWIAACLGITLNATWHFFRAWGPKYLQSLSGTPYSENEMLNISTFYYAIADVGTLMAGFLAARLAMFGMTPHGSRLAVSLACALMCASSLLLPSLPRGPLFLTILFVIGFGSLGLFPMYYSVTQELSAQHQGKVTGSLSFLIWISLAGYQYVAGRVIQDMGYHVMLVVAGLLPMIGVLILAIGWTNNEQRSDTGR